MSHNSLYPAFVQVFYTSPFGSGHVMQLPLRDWQGGVTGPDPLGFSTAWNEDPIGVLTMLEDLLNELVTQVPDNVAFERATVFTLPEPSGPIQPRATATLVDIVGTDATPGWQKAVQKTFSFYDTEFNQVRIQIMDASSGDDFDKQTDFSSSPASDIAASFGNVTFAFASRAGFRPSTGISIINTLNDKLRRAYGMS